MKRSGLFVFFVLFSLGMARAEKICSPIDLRNPNTAPVRNQYFVDPSDGLSHDTNLCHAISASNLLGQVMGEAISPEALVVFDWETSGETKYSDLVTDFNRDLTGHSKDDIECAFKQGVISQSTLNKWAQEFESKPDQTNCKAQMSDTNKIFAATSSAHQVNSIQALMNVSFQEKFTFQNLKDLLDKISPEKIEIKGWQVEEMKSDGRNKDVLLKKVDKVLNEKRFVALHTSGHIITIVGRTTECEYIIQDSIPKSAWQRHDKERESSSWSDSHPHSKFIDEHFQLWGQEDILANISSITWLEPSGRLAFTE